MPNGAEIKFRGNDVEPTHTCHHILLSFNEKRKLFRRMGGNVSRFFLSSRTFSLLYILFCVVKKERRNKVRQE